MITITRIYDFEAGHHLTGLSEGHKCARPHGHNYRVEVELAPCGTKLTSGFVPEVGAPLVNGFVLDAATLDLFLKPILAGLDHRDLNGPLECGGPPADAMMAQPTAENIALYLWWRLAPLENSQMALRHRVTVHENARLSATVTP
jgi:6-pyruvoyltetrahydropterin/6-carboxytetrahydropterin synthase